MAYDAVDMKKFLVIVALIMTLAALAALAVLLTSRHVEEAPLLAAGGKPMAVRLSPSLPYYLQTDPPWEAETIGPQRERMASIGCTVTCVATGLTALGHPLDPGQVRAKLEQADGFTPGGLVIWDKVKVLTNGAVQIQLPPLSYEVIDAELLAQRPVIAKIMLADTVPHWVLIIGKEGREYLAMDPLNQQRKLIQVSSRSRGIYAIRVFRKQ